MCPSLDYTTFSLLPSTHSFPRLTVSHPLHYRQPLTKRNSTSFTLNFQPRPCGNSLLRLLFPGIGTAFKRKFSGSSAIPTEPSSRARARCETTTCRARLFCSLTSQRARTLPWLLSRRLSSPLAYGHCALSDARIPDSEISGRDVTLSGMYNVPVCICTCIICTCTRSIGLRVYTREK